MPDSFATALTDPLLCEAYAHWRSLPRQDGVPPRSTLDPSDVPHLLPFMVLTETAGSGRYRFRLAGTEVERHFGRPMTGRVVDDLLHGDYLAYVVDLYDTVIRRRTAVYSRSAYGAFDAVLATRRLMLPFSTDGATVDRILTVQTFHYARGEPSTAKGVAGLQGGFRDLDRLVAADLSGA
jgi:hypothetical protein